MKTRDPTVGRIAPPGGAGDGGTRIGVAAEEGGAGGEARGDDAAEPPPEEMIFAKRRYSVERRRVRQQIKRREWEGTRTEITQGGQQKRGSTWEGLSPPQRKRGSN